MKETRVLVTVRVPDGTDDTDVALTVGNELDEVFKQAFEAGTLDWEVAGSVLAVRSGELPAALIALADDANAVQAAHVALEDQLIALRDAGVQATGPRGHARNGLSVCDPSGAPSPVIRAGTEDAVRMTLRALAGYLADPPATARRIEEIRREMGVT